jgi:hypothetical protein
MGNSQWKVEIVSDNSLHDAESDSQVTTDTPDDQFLRALTAKNYRDTGNEVIKGSVALSARGELRSGGRLANRNSRVSSDARIPDNRKARRILARYGSREAIQEFIDDFGYECTVDEFINRFVPGGRKVRV